ncbi:MAG TPA: TonB-dependent receptor [Thermodesulfobacteriota bacterium]|nr:TonB-dependent receptor [Thermodesulfobacteriota bacterium]
MRKRFLDFIQFSPPLLWGRIKVRGIYFPSPHPSLPSQKGEGVKHYSSLYLIKLVLLFLLLSSPILAQEETTEELEPVVVTATKIPTPISQLGASVEIITEDEIRKQEAKDVIEVLRNVAGLNIVQSGSRGSPTSLFVRGGESDFNLILIDGVQVNDIGGSFDLGRLTTDNIERIEIVKGSHSAIYGSDAVTSVINIITKKGAGKPTLGASAALGAHKENEGSLIQEYKASLQGGRENFGLSLGYGRIDDNGILDVNNEYTNNTFSGALNFRPLDILDISVTARYQDSLVEFPTEFAGDRFDPLDPEQFTEVEDLALGSNVSFTPTNWWEHVLLLGLHKRDLFSEDNPNPADTFFDDPMVASTTSTDEKRFSIDYRWNFYYEAMGTVDSVTTLGFEYEKEEAEQSFVSSFGTSGFDKSRNNFAVYFQEQAGFFERLFITGGLRVDDNENFGTELSPRASIAFLIKETGTKLRGGVGRGIKEPTIIENFGLGVFTIGNPDLEPEESTSWEIGFDQEVIGEILELNFTFFWNKLDNLIVFSTAPFPNGTNFENIQEAKTKGIEVGGTLRPCEGLTIKGNYTFLDTEVTDDGGLDFVGFMEGEELIRRPEHSFSFIVNYFYRGLNLNLNGTYVGRRDDIDFSDFVTFIPRRVTNDDYLKLDLAAHYEVPLRFPYLKEVRIFTRIENLLDDDYEEVFGFSAPGFNFIVGLSFRI